MASGPLPIDALLIKALPPSLRDTTSVRSCHPIPLLDRCVPCTPYYRHFSLSSFSDKRNKTKQNPQNRTTTTANPRNLVPTSPEATSALLPLSAKLLSHGYQCPLYRDASDVPLRVPLLCSPGPRPPLVHLPSVFFLVLSFADILFQGPLVWKTPFLSHLPMVLLLLTPLRF